MKIKKITLGKSISGNAGCTNGNHDVPVIIEFLTMVRSGKISLVAVLTAVTGLSRTVICSTKSVS